ncbi:hypothetical protein BD309DRAFT_991195 [Dichomitus squalens]|uniref:MARVEL domain-containing protein n=2 Tax=Dichomitus squalens TaxID=114155 RepID=A0A4Q9MV68_9APHY|nr:uncharacterized protein DICSQDRAFT_173907 [Dichomitus squalens LYAD-421 SS1]EJF57449.1 hypothetical protein DICSQDRAFT_173907 [Dichomitus squalens LYAD-421 SS1]TBU31277.1 hypothetical protein BD311DRAFT_804775 [Dichomitus squalens]TBU43141.1 hypothetical protein BD309DRAFT_991195 [Dichomitus squalens]TBU57218.1 hypothetical protein BD310DRAFT_978309 [Dichomitus squalens]
MAGLYVYRVLSLLLAAIFAIVVLALSVQDHSAETTVFLGTFVYTRMGVAAGIMSAVTLPLLLIGGHLRSVPLCSTILFEVFWLSVLGWLWIATAGLTFADPNIRILDQDVTGCDLYTDEPDTFKVCRDSQPIGILSAVTGAILQLYVITLFVVALQHSNNGKSVWGTSVRKSGKNESAV